MANITITTCDQSPSCILENPKYREDTLYFSGADVWAQNTILARLLVSATITIAYTRAGTSTYTVAAAADSGRTPEVGAYTITAGTLVAGVGTWTAVAPSGQHEQFTSTAADDDLEFPNLGFTLTTTAGGGTAWETGDVITATTTAQSGTPLVLYDVDGVNGAQVPVAILPYAVTATGAGSIACSALIGGVVRRDKLVIDAGDTVSNSIIDLLAANSNITVQNNTDVSVLDNGAS